jgi:tetratricopeptide (TPR) repeat protein
MVAMFLQIDPAALRPLYEQALERRRKEFGAADPRTAQAARDLGLFLAGIGDSAGARPALAEAVRVDEQAFGAAAVQTLADVAELAAVSPPRTGEAMWRRASAAEDAGLAIRAWMALGSLRGTAADRAGAAAFYRKALARQEDAAGKDSPAIPAILQSLAEMVETREAIALLERALIVGRAIQGAHHPSNGLIEAALAAELLAAGRTDDALKAAADALAIDQETVGIEHPRSARAMTTMARVLQAQKQMECREHVSPGALDRRERLRPGARADADRRPDPGEIPARHGPPGRGRRVREAGSEPVAPLLPVEDELQVGVASRARERQGLAVGR